MYLEPAYNDNIFLYAIVYNDNVGQKSDSIHNTISFILETPMVEM